MSSDLREIEDRLASIESTASELDRDLDQPGELTDRQTDHLDKMLKAVESDPETGDRLAEVSELIHAEKEGESPKERRARRERHEFTPGEEALLDLLTGGDGEVRR